MPVLGRVERRGKQRRKDVESARRYLGMERRVGDRRAIERLREEDSLELAGVSMHLTDQRISPKSPDAGPTL